MNGFKRFKGFRFSNVVQPSKKGNKLFFLALLGGTIGIIFPLIYSGDRSAIEVLGF